MPAKNNHKPRLNLIGETFEKLKVIEYYGYTQGKTGVIYHQWRCQCECGNEKIVATHTLMSGHCKSCGCLSHAAKNPSHTHNMANTRLYNIWRSMKGRCYTKSNTMYKHYGNRGITVCNEWRGKNGFINFYNWSMENGYNPNTKGTECSIDRIDVNGNYEPDNCRWVDSYAQANNKTNTVRHEINGEYLTIREISEKYNFPYKLLKGRIDNKETVYQALYGDHDIGTKLKFNGETKTLIEWSRITGIKPITIHARLRRGWSVEDALTKPIRKSNRIY